MDGAVGFIAGAIAITVIYGINGVFADAHTFEQLAKPCLEQGYTKAKCREMIYIPQSESK